MNHERVVMITGAARRVGAQTARTLHGAGWRVVIHHHRSTGEAHALVESLNALRPAARPGWRPICSTPTVCRHW